MAVALKAGELDLHVLAEFVAACGETYSFKIWKSLQRRSEHPIITAEVTVLASLKRLEKWGHIERSASVPIPTASTTGEPSKRICHYYHITEEGKAILTLMLKDWQVVFGRINESDERQKGVGKDKQVS
jgi:DNA-binding PadR family transcriptional regulator